VAETWRGTEAMGICWQHIEWHTDRTGVRYRHNPTCMLSDKLKDRKGR
jgi:hypothetical protein